MEKVSNESKFALGTMVILCIFMWGTFTSLKRELSASLDMQKRAFGILTETLGIQSEIVRLHKDTASQNEKITKYLSDVSPEFRYRVNMLEKMDRIEDSLSRLK